MYWRSASGFCLWPLIVREKLSALYVALSAQQHQSVEYRREKERLLYILGKKMATPQQQLLDQHHVFQQKNRRHITENH